MQYEIMRTTKRKDYSDHFARKGDNHSDNLLKEMKTKDVDVDVRIKSMNKDELLTVTYHFFIYDQFDDQVQELLEVMTKLARKLRNDLGIYSVHATTETIHKVEGILLEAVTLENNENQGCDIIQQKLQSIMDDVHMKGKKTQIAYDYLMKRKIRIQVGK